MTVLGMQSVAELQDELNNFDSEMASLDAAFAKFKSSWQSSDASAYNDWYTDYMALKNRYQTAKVNAQFTIAATPSALASVTPADGDYLAVLKAWRQAATDTQGNEGQVQKGDYDDLWARLSAAQGAPVQVTVVQPKATDADLSAYKAADDVLKNIGLPAKPMPLWKKVGIGVGAALLGAVGIRIVVR